MVSVVNSWGNSYGQGTTLASVTPALQSCVVPLTNAYSVGGGSGTPTAGNWLFTLASWTQDPSIAHVHVGVGDDIHSWWRQYPGVLRRRERPHLHQLHPEHRESPRVRVRRRRMTRSPRSTSSSWKSPASAPGTPWSGPNTNYAAAATSLSLSLSAPGAASFFIGAVGGDTTAATQTFAPGGYTTLHTLSQSNGVEPSRG